MANPNYAHIRYSSGRESTVSVVVRPRTLRSRPRPRTLRSRPRPRTSKFFEAKAKDTQAEAKAKDMQVEAKDMDQGQLAFFGFQYKISKCGSFGHEIMVSKQFMAYYCSISISLFLHHHQQKAISYISDVKQAQIKSSVE